MQNTHAHHSSVNRHQAVCRMLKLRPLCPVLAPQRGLARHTQAQASSSIRHRTSCRLAEPTVRRRHAFHSAGGVAVPPHKVGVCQAAAQQHLVWYIAAHHRRALIHKALHHLPHRLPYYPDCLGGLQDILLSGCWQPSACLWVSCGTMTRWHSPAGRPRALQKHAHSLLMHKLVCRP